jgi:hypothetical protein
VDGDLELGGGGVAALGHAGDGLVGVAVDEVEEVFDDGEASDAVGAATAAGALRQELGVVNFASNVLSSRGPRKMKVATPLLAGDKPAVFRPDKDEDSMINQFKQGLTQNMFLMINKPPKWNEHVRSATRERRADAGALPSSLSSPQPAHLPHQVGAYVLNFNGRVTMASVKNYIRPLSTGTSVTFSVPRVRCSKPRLANLRSRSASCAC